MPMGTPSLRRQRTSLLGFFRISDLQSNGATAETGDKHAPLRMTLSQIHASNAVA
jgi:hypothetical protein